MAAGIWQRSGATVHKGVSVVTFEEHPPLVTTTDGASLYAGMAEGFSEYRPLARKPALMCSGQSEVSNSCFTRDGSTSLLTLAALVLVLYSLSNILHAAFMGPKTQTSNGWSMWEVWEGRQIRWTFLALACSSSSMLM